MRIRGNPIDIATPDDAPLRPRNMEAMTAASTAPLERSVSQQSGTSIRSYRSGARTRKRLTSQPSSSASSIAPSDKSLTSFPSFSPDSPREERTSFFRNDDSTTVTSSRKTSGRSEANTQQSDAQGQNQARGPPLPRRPEAVQPSAIVDHLTTTSPASAARGALFEDAPPASRTIPGALHHAADEHIERLIARHGAVNLVRQIAEDLAQRDAQIASMRRRADERERALRKIVLECGLSSLDLETRLRAVEQEARTNGASRRVSGDGLSDLMTDAMADDVRHRYTGSAFDDATIRASSVPLRADSDTEGARGSARGWKEYFWGGGSQKKSSRANSTSRDAGRLPPAVVKAAPAERRPALQDDLFNPPEDEPAQSRSGASSVHSVHGPRKPSLASMALRLVAGGASVGRDGEIRGRANSAQGGGSLRTSSNSSVKTSSSARAASAQGGPKALMAMRRPTGPIRPIEVPPRSQVPERWDTMVATPGGDPVARQQSYGPVEMDTILPAEAQPPTLTHIYNNHLGADYLTDRFGFIYDQRRKKRQREAAQMARHAKRGSRAEMISHGRNGLSPVLLEDNASGTVSVGSDGRPGTPNSSEELREDAKPKRWQDYLKIATFPTELLSHTPSISAQGFEVLEALETPKSPSHSPSIMSEDRGFLPSATTTAAITPGDTDTQPPSEGELSALAATLAKEDAEPVKLLLDNLNQLHDTLQREKTVRWNDFLRKVRAERKRDGEAAAAAAAAAAEARFQRATAVMPETRLADGELIGVASLGLQGKIGRAKATEFRALVLGGIPVAYRAKIWSECCGAKALRVPGYYDALAGEVWEEREDDPQVVAQIKADITRTLTDNIFFRKGPGVQKLHEVLLAYSRRNPDVGYCQGMNLVVANLLLVTPSAEDAFWILASMVESILPPHYFDHSLLASRADQVVLRQYVTEVLPRLSAHFDALAIDLETMTFQWFLSLFTDCLSAEALFRVWDVLLCSPHDGGAFLFQVALALLKLNESLLLACASPAEVYTYINHQMTNHAISIDGLVQASEALRRLVKKEEIEVRRAGAIEGERELVKAREERLRERRANQQLQGKAGRAVAVVGEEGASDGMVADRSVSSSVGGGSETKRLTGPGPGTGEGGGGENAGTGPERGGAEAE